ncbi:MAG TPA: lysine--tRNA ligase [Candidatus Limnocylindria bacterium]|jgi:lysyl-tRNA synthetase class 1
MTQTPTDRELFWADAVAASLPRNVKHVIRDSKTPSGPVPISALRGPVITDALYRAFREHGLEVRYVFTIDDYDPMDSQSMKQQAGMAEHMGKPFFKIPSPDPAKDFARFHAERFLSTFEHVGIHPQEIHWLRDLYGSGTLDHEIELVLRSADAVRRVYAEVSNVQKDPDWLPVWVICENCGRIGTTHATDFDGTTVAYECRKDYVAWAEGCGHRGRIAPFKGNAKLPWNLQWCAMWDHFDVTYEEGGKDLLTAGGSRDRANELYRAIWEREPPAGLVHEFFTIGGKKMATSRGLGASAVELVELYPGEVVRFLLLRTHPKRAVEFDPAGNTLPRLYDEYDRCADAFLEDPGSDFGKIWTLSQVSADAEPIVFRVRFGTIADWLQIPSIEPHAEAAKRKKAALTDAEARELDRRIALAQIWLDRWAPDEARFAVAAGLPPATATLTAPQRAFLERAKAEVGRITEPEQMQERLYEIAKEVGLTTPEGKVSKAAFEALYLTFIGKPNGPKAAWLLVTLKPEFVIARLDEAARAK